MVYHIGVFRGVIKNVPFMTFILPHVSNIIEWWTKFWVDPLMSDPIYPENALL
jgi:hypothetical protein